MKNKVDDVPSATPNRMLEALEIFEEVNANKFFVKAAMILFLNKKDLFEKKLHFGVYGPQDQGAYTAFYQGRFEVGRRYDTTNITWVGEH